MIRVVDPATEQVIAAYEEHSPAGIEAVVVRARLAQRAWSFRPPHARARLLASVAAVFRTRVDEYAELITREVGKPLTEARAEVDKCVRVCEYYAAEGERLLADEAVETGTARSFVAYEPLGVVLAVMPWNYPFWQVVRFAAPTLMAGNAGLVKHAPNASGCALAVEDAFRSAGALEGLLSCLLVDERSVAATTAALIEDPRIAAVTLTGSERAGAAVAAAAGRALKKAVLELGGSDPFVVLADADVAIAAEQAARARFQNAGQACIAAKRLLVAEAVADEFEARFIDVVAALRVGDPHAPDTNVGPLARADLLETLARQVAESIDQGAELRLGGHRLDRPGYFFAPTILTGVSPGMTVFREETFGPVASVTRFADEQQALALANDTRYGLGASVWSRDPERARALGRQIESGALFVNGVVSSDPRLPFGGVKRSGFGRELAAAGLREFTNLRTYSIAA